MMGIVWHYCNKCGYPVLPDQRVGGVICMCGIAKEQPMNAEKKSPGLYRQTLFNVDGIDEIRTLRRRVLFWRLVAFGAFILFLFSWRYGH